MLGLITFLIAGTLATAIVIYIAYLTVERLRSEIKGRISDATEASINELLQSGKIKVVYLDAISAGGHVQKVKIEADSVSSEITRGATYHLR